MRNLALSLGILLGLAGIGNAAPVSPATYRCAVQQFGGRTDGWCLKLSDKTGVFFIDGVSKAELDPSGNLQIDGSLTVDGSTSFASLMLSGDLTVTGNDITFGNTGTISNATNGAITFGETSENLVATATADLWTFSSSTNATVAFTPSVAFADSLVLSDGLIIDQTANGNLSITEGGEDWIRTVTSNTLTDTTTTGVTLLDDTAWQRAQRRKTITSPADPYAFAVADCGAVIFTGTDNETITLPDAATANAGCMITLVNTAATGGALIEFDTHASDGIKGSCVGIDGAGAATLVEQAGTDGQNLINTKATQETGDTATIVSDGVADWFLTSCIGEWAES